MDIPSFGFGTWKASDAVLLENALIYAIEEAGIRHIDTAHIYLNEDFIGSTLQKIFAKGKIKRSDLFITTKLWVTNRRPSLVEPALLDSLKRLQLEYVDLYLIHSPVSFVPQPNNDLFPKDANGSPLLEHIDIIDTWIEFEKLLAKGLTKHIGVSNFSIEMLERMKLSPRVKIQPYTNQIELHLYNQQWAQIDYLTKNNIRLTSWSSFANGVVGPYGVELLEDPVLKEVAKEVGRTPSQVALKFLLQLSPIVGVIPKSLSAEHIKENFDLNFVIPPTQFEKLKKLNQAWRVVDFVTLFGYDVLSLGV